MKNYDLIVIGAGSGGVRAARLAAQQGQKTLVIEKRHWGGTCVNLGCVPKKLLVYASDYARTLRHSHDYSFPSISYESSLPHWHKLTTRINAETSRLQGVYQKLLQDNNVDMLSGTAILTSPDTVTLEGSSEEFSASKILLATGSRPRIPDIPGHELGITSDNMFSLSQLPKSIAIVGAGYIGLEFACIMAAFGVKVHLLNRSETFLRNFDVEIAAFAIEQVEQEPNITIHRNTTIKHLKQAAADKVIEASITQDGQEQQLSVEQVLFATGRVPNTNNLGLQDFKITSKDGFIEVDEFYQSILPSIYALGDVVGHLALTPVAIAEAKIFIAKHIIKNQQVSPLDYESIPMAVFSRPEIAMVGMSEQQAAAQAAAKPSDQFSVKTYKSKFNPLSEALRQHKQPFFMKLVCDNSNNRILGVHLCGTGAAEMIHGFVPLYKNRLSKDDLDEAVGVHPTIMEEIFTLN